MPTVVLDASAGVELLLRTPAGDRAEALLRGSHVVVPAHFDAEVLSALGRLARSEELEDGAVAPLIASLSRAPFTRAPVAPLLQTAWSLRQNVALRDALYVALARRQGALLVTGDARLSKAPHLGVAIALVAETSKED
jgi:predicted nucleic acid-binding protein